MDTRYRPSDLRSVPRNWVFCSRRCQAAFHALYGSWKDKDPELEEVFMIDPTEMELAAMRACLRPFGEAAAEIGFDKPLGHYSEAEALAVVNAIVTAWTEAMVATHEQALSAPVRPVGRTA
jgi:hypothetical protein